MLNIIKKELEQYIVKEFCNIKCIDLLNIIQKFEIGKNYLLIIISDDNNIQAIIWLDIYDYNKYNKYLFNYSSHIYAKYRGMSNTNLIFYEIEQSFNSQRFIQILLHVFANCYNILETFSHSHVIELNNITLGKIIVEYQRLSNILDEKIIFYPQLINFKDENFCYYYKHFTQIL